jgi:hypothetical protein
MSYWKLNEDPFYDEDGVLIDEDTEWEDEDGCGSDMIDTSPYATINS